MNIRTHAFGPTRPTKHALMGIRYIDDVGGAAPAAPVEPPAAAPAAPAPPAAPPAVPAPPAPAAPVNVQGDRDDYIRDLRDENKTRRIALEQATASAAESATATASLTAERDALRRDNAVILAAPGLQANAALLLDSASFTKEFASVDPSDKEAVKAAITAAIEKNAAFSTGPALPPTSGGGHQGGQPSASPRSLDSAVKTALGG